MRARVSCWFYVLLELASSYLLIVLAQPPKFRKIPGNPWATQPRETGRLTAEPFPHPLFL